MGRFKNTIYRSTFLIEVKSCHWKPPVRCYVSKKVLKWVSSITIKFKLKPRVLEVQKTVNTIYGGVIVPTQQMN